MTNDKRARDLVYEEALKAGADPCSDPGCVFGHPGGMGTNGGCQHLKGSHEDRQTIRKLAQIARALALRLSKLEEVK